MTNTTHPLDHPAWHALTTTHAHHAISTPHARRYPPSHSPLAATPHLSQSELHDLATLYQPGEKALFFTREPLPTIPTWHVKHQAPLIQMTWHGQPPETPANVHELQDHDVPDMLELARLTRPGPFKERTRELGHYLGLRERGQLIAMAGERLQLTGFTELSAVCTHPDHTSKGYATTLVLELCRRATTRGVTPFLHLASTNDRARALYRHLGFRERAQLTVTVLQRTEHP